MYKPIAPCKECKKRGVEACLACEEWKEYRAQLLIYYDEEHRKKSVYRAAIDKRTKRLKNARRFLNGEMK